MRRKERQEILKVHKQLEKLEAEVLGIKSELNQYFTAEEQIILQYESSIGRNETRLEELETTEQKRTYADSCREYLQFGAEVEACLAGKLKQTAAVRVGTVPTVLRKTGCSNADMYITQKHLRNIHRTSEEGKGRMAHYHDLDIMQIKKLPELLKEPLMIIAEKKHQETLTVVLDARDKQGNRLIVPVKRNGQASYRGKMVNANCILSVYGKENFVRYLKKAVEEKDILYTDKKISTRLGEKPLQLRQFLDTSTYMNRIQQSEKNVNDLEKKKENFL